MTAVSGGARLNTTLSKVQVRILANDIPVRFAVSHIIVLENHTNVVAWIYKGLDESGSNMIASVNRASSVAWYLQSDSAIGNKDFHKTSGTVVFAKNETRKMINITIIDDNIPEKSENFTVHLTNLSADLSLAEPSKCTVQILHSDDHMGVFELARDGNITISEDADSNVVQFIVNRTAGAFGMVNVTWTIVSSHANLSDQISPLNGVVTFGDGEHQKLVNITAADDNVPEEASSFVIELKSVSAGRITNDPLGRSKKILVKDSDDVYGVFEFLNEAYQRLILVRSITLSI